MEWAAAANSTAAAVQIYYAFRSGQIRLGDSRRPRAGSWLGIFIQELRIEGLGDLCRSVRAAAARGQISRGGDGKRPANITQSGREYWRRCRSDYSRIDGN